VLEIQAVVLVVIPHSDMVG